jgi:hypothetical protein
VAAVAIAIQGELHYVSQEQRLMVKGHFLVGTKEYTIKVTITITILVFQVFQNSL